ncbi:Phage tail length tape-measure protein [Lachnospiraceae bacterium TWA4]|nr:Phage tail length tape-measure protein [Lachnospiraceae bacterium TWA4]
MAMNRIKGITVEIGGDTTKLQTALKGVNSEIRNTQSQLKDVDKLLKLDPGNTELLSQKHRLLGDAVKATKEKLETLKTAAEQANTALANGDISQSQYDALQREIIETEQDLERLESQANQSSVAVQKIAASGEKLKKVGGTVTSAGQKMMPVTAGVTALGVASVKTAANFEKSMSQVQSTMGITKDSMSTVDGQSVNTMDTLSKLAKKLGSESAFSASQCADGLNYLALAGYNTEQMCKTLPTVLNLAAAGNMELSDASDQVTDAMSALGLGVTDAEKMVDQMAKTSSTTNTSVGQLGEGILTIGATAKSIKGGTAELNTALGILANNGLKGAEGGTHLRNIILSLQNPTDKAAGAMEQLGLQVYDSEGNMRSLNDILGDMNKSMDGMTAEEKSNLISKIFNKTDLSSVNALLANTGTTWDDLQQSITNSGRAAQQMADTQLDNLEGQITILKSAIEGLAISFGELLMPSIKLIIGWVQSFVDWLNGMDEGTKKVIITVALLAAALAPILIVIGKVIIAVGTIMTLVPKISAMITTVKTAFAALNTTMLANPIALIIVAISALVAAFIYLWNTNEEFRQFWMKLWENVKQVAISVWTAIKNFMQTTWQSILQLAKTIWTGLKTFFTTLWSGIQGVFTLTVTAIKNFLSSAWTAIAQTVRTIFTGIKTSISTIWTGIKTVTVTIVTGIKNFLVTTWQGIKTTLSMILTSIKNLFSTIWNGILALVSRVVSTIKTTITTAWTSIKSTISSVMSGICTVVTQTFSSMLSGIKTTMGGVYSTIKSGFTKAISFIKGLASLGFKWGADIIGGIVKGIKSCIGDVKDAVKSVAEKIKSFLHFSVPDEGPLTDFESWMPDFMQGLAKGITSSRGLIQKAVKGVASDLILQPSVKTMNVPTVSTNSSASGVDATSLISAIKEAVGGMQTSVKDIVIPVYVGGTLVDEVIVQAQQRMNLRSGGR